METAATGTPGDHGAQEKAFLLGKLGLLVQRLDKKLDEIQAAWVGLRIGVMPVKGELPSLEDAAFSRYSPRVIPALVDQKDLLPKLTAKLENLEKLYLELLALSKEEKETRTKLLGLNRVPQGEPKQDDPGKD